ncbi:hypothetical protein BDR03DRAFT_1018943 [Suillus americanus]|nr:hypothetical protein BDR03DRAFT_1018943 [Suillus americanus]
MPPDSIYWTSEQLEWMDDQVAIYSWCYEDNDLLLFWPSLFEVYFLCWPERQILLPDIPESQVLTDEQHRALSEAEDCRKFRIKTWLEYKRTLSSAWIPYLPFLTGSTDERQAVLQLEMPPATWASKEQTLWLREQLPTYVEFAKEGQYTQFWPILNGGWFGKYPEHAVLFPDIPEDLLSPEQVSAVEEAKTARKVQLQTWYRWRTNGSKKNRSLKKTSTVFDNALQPKRRAKTEAEIYSEMYYDERIKPLVVAEAEAGNVATSGKRVALGRKFSKELLEDESEDVKAEIRAKYEQRLKALKKGAKRSTHFLDDNDINDGDEEMDAEVIARGIDDLPVICHRFAQLVKQKTRFVVSFMFAGPDPRNDWDMTTLSCHPSETPKGKSFHELYETADRAFLEAFQQYAELIFPANKRKPDAITTNGDDNCAKKSEEGDEGEPEEDDGQLVEEDSQQGKETQLCEFEGGRAGTGMGSSDNGDASAGPATAFFSIPGASLNDASAAPGLGDINHASMAPGALAGAIESNDAGCGSHVYGAQAAVYRTQAQAYETQTELPYNMHPPLGYDIQANTTLSTTPTPMLM